MDLDTDIHMVWDKDLEEEERKDQDKGENNFSVCSDWDSDFYEQDRKSPEIKDKRTMKGRQPKVAPHSCQLLHLLFIPLNPPLNNSLKGPVRHLQKNKTNARPS